jgi:hypothetical protein
LKRDQFAQKLQNKWNYTRRFTIAAPLLKIASRKTGLFNAIKKSLVNSQTAEFPRIELAHSMTLWEKHEDASNCY